MSNPIDTAQWVPSLPEHWKNSLLGTLFAIGRFNLCSGLDIARIVDAQVAAKFAALKPPSVSHLTAFMRWAKTMQAAIPSEDVTFLRLVLARAQRDIDEVPPHWFSTELRWCPQCAMEETHLIAHQHRAIRHCPVHHVRLRQFCDYCGVVRRYRVVRGIEFLECQRCSSRQSLPYWERHDTVSALARTATPNPRVVAEQVVIPGLPISADPLGAYGISPQDLRILYVERTLPRALQSPQTQVLSRYFSYEGSPCAVLNPPASHDEGVHRIMSRAHALAALSGHTCMFEPPGSRPEEGPCCPWQVGFQLWAWRVDAGLFASAQRHTGVDAQTYEGAHLGLCLSAAWFADAQFSAAQDHDAYRMLLRWLEPGILRWLPADDDERHPQGKTLGLLRHDYQWFCLPCRKKLLDVARIRRQLDAVRQRCADELVGDVLQDVRWIMDQVRIAPALP